MLSSSLFAAASALQALEARNVSSSAGLRSSLLSTLARRRTWLVGGAASVVGWGLEAVALSLASVALVQPALGLGLIVLLVLGVRVLHERIGALEIGGAAAIAIAVAGLAWAAPSHSTTFTTAGTWVVAVALVATAAAPALLRAGGRGGGLATSVAAGIGWACVGLATALVVDALADRRWLVCVAWLLAVGLASASTLLAEMTALQTWPATRAIPVVFALEMGLPAAAAPALAHGVPPHPVVFGLALALACAGAVAVGSSRGVARQLQA